MAEKVTKTAKTAEEKVTKTTKAPAKKTTKKIPASKAVEFTATGRRKNSIARALCKADEALKVEIKKAGFLTRDARVKERKKYGLKKARKAPQFRKR